MQDVRGLKALQLDALKEGANIGAGPAAPAPSQPTNPRIMISVPGINTARLEEGPEPLGNAGAGVAAGRRHMARARLRVLRRARVPHRHGGGTPGAFPAAP